MDLLSYLGLVESRSCTMAHLRSRSLNIVSLSDMIEGSYRSWDLYTTGQLVDGLQQKKKTVFIRRKWNHVIFSRATILSFHPVLYVDRVVMPYTLQKKILKEFHTGLPGILRMKSLMKGYTYWPRIDQDIENLVKQCRGCQLAARDPLVKIQSWPKTDVPWT